VPARADHQQVTLGGSVDQYLCGGALHDHALDLHVAQLTKLGDRSLENRLRRLAPSSTVVCGKGAQTSRV
jgi:hypothetical protein